MGSGRTLRHCRADARRSLNLIWAGISALLSGIACLICIERPRLHREELFEDHRPGCIRTLKGDFDVAFRRLTTFDAVGRLRDRKVALEIGSKVHLSFQTLDDLPATVGHRKGRNVTLLLDLSEATRRSLVVKLYGAPNENLALEARMGEALFGLFRRGFGRN